MCICANEMTLKKLLLRLIGCVVRVPLCKTCECNYNQMAGSCVRHNLENMLANSVVAFVFEL